MGHSIFINSETNIHFITLTNDKLSATFLNFGARWYNFLVPDKNQLVENILLSIDTPREILADYAQFGALIGPVAGRVKEAKWGQFSLEANDGKHHVHGGSHGWANQFWDYTIEETKDKTKVSFSLTDTLSGYPGPIHVINTYELTTSSVIMTTQITSKEKTIVNPTNHAYFNLSGNAKRSINNHSLKINSTNRLELDSEHIPTGKIIPLKNTAYDFKESTQLDTAFLNLKDGLNDPYLLNQTTEAQIILSDSISGRKLTIYSNRESVIVFSTTDFEAEFKVNNQQMTSELGIALETQELPDIVNHPEWGNIELPAGKTKQYQTIYEIDFI